MKIKIKNVFAAVENDVVLAGLEDNKNVALGEATNGPNLVISCKTKTGYPVFINMPKTACLAIQFLGDSE